jgi:hypothetical protein
MAYRYFAILFFMLKISRIRTCENNRSCSIFHHESYKKWFGNFLNFLRFSTRFTISCKAATLWKMEFFTETPAKNQGSAIGSLGRGRRRRRPNSGEPAALPAGVAVGHEHLLT